MNVIKTISCVKECFINVPYLKSTQLMIKDRITPQELDMEPVGHGSLLTDPTRVPLPDPQLQPTHFHAYLLITLAPVTDYLKS